MKVYIVQSAENKEGENVFSYIYPNNSSTAVIKSYEHAVEFVREMMINDWDIKEELIVFKKAEEDPRITYAIESSNELPGCDLFWACIIERELQD